MVVVFCRLVLFYCFTSALGKKFVSKRSLIISSPPLSLSLSLSLSLAAAVAAAVAVAVAALSLNEFDDDDDEDSFTRAQINSHVSFY